MLKSIYFFFLALFCFSCTQHYIPPQVTALHTEKPSFSKPSPSMERAPQGASRQEAIAKHPLSKPYTIVIDAGHGGKDPGTVSKKNDYEEKKLTLSTAIMLQGYLKNLGYHTILTRDEDVFIPLGTRAQIANNKRADLFVSLHYNHSPSYDIQGVEVYFYQEGGGMRTASSRKLGELVLNRVVRNTGAESRGTKKGNFAVIRETKMPAILVECGYLSHAKERIKIKDPHYRQQIAMGIAKGIDSYLCSKG